jgi:hypothetical protein
MAKTPYQIHQEIEQEDAAEEYKQIIEKPELTPEEIWSIRPENFYEWRKKYDYPRILNYFSQKLNGFEDWKKESKLTDDLLMSFGISNCINPNPAKDKSKYIIEREWENEKSRFISYQNIDKKFYRLGPNPVKHKVISSFMGYIDWCNAKGIRIMEDWRDNGIISRPSKSNPVGYPDDIEVTILNGLKLLKVGGIEVQPDAFNLIKPKYFEFVNADRLKMKGRMATQGRELIFENSFLDNTQFEELDLGLVIISNCSMGNTLIVNSKLQQWQFNLSSATGKVYYTDLRMVSVFGGYFDLDCYDCTFDRVEARHNSKHNIGFEITYRTFKKVYAAQGDDKKAIEYFLLEKTMERQRIKKEIGLYPQTTLFKPTRKERLIVQAKHSIRTAISYGIHWLNNFYWGYGRKPFRVVRNSIGLIVFFGLLYWIDKGNINLPAHDTNFSFFDSLYYSTVTFTTLGYGDFTPHGYLKAISAIEACVGGLSLGFLVAAFSNFKY